MFDGISSDGGLTEQIAQTLLRGGHLGSAELERAQHLRAQTNERLDLILTKLGLVSERSMAEVLPACLEVPLAEPSDYPATPLLEDQLSAAFLKRVRAVPLCDSAESLVLAMADPFDRFVSDAIGLRLGKAVLRWVGVPEDIEAAHARLYAGNSGSVEEILDGDAVQTADETEQDVERLRDLASEAPVIRLVNHLVGKAVEMRASDIHIEPFERRLRVRYRVDGVLREVQAPPSRLRAAVVSRIKIMAKLNIAETRLPQDGRIKLAIRGKEIDLRVSTVPTLYGESLVLRILDQDAVALDLTTLGLDETQREAFLTILERPNGILLVTGPTGSGKTTTLYASLLRLNSGERKILTVEDPIEYQLEGINQVQVKAQIGLGFANLLRSFLRQDPDVMMIGEIRDLETAQIAVQAALTGHIVLSTLHTNDSAATITRLLDMGVEDYLIASSLNGVVAQRLVRRLCPHCREAYAPLPEMVAQLKLGELTEGQTPTLYRAKGCADCNGNGYRGRVSVLEILELTDPIRSLVLRRAPAREIQRAALAEGMRSMHRDGLGKALQGLTSLEEVMRVTHEA